MSTKYRIGKEVPTNVLCNRLGELSDCVTKGSTREFYMRIPAEVDNDADLVISEAKRRITELRTVLLIAKLELESWNLQQGDEATKKIIADCSRILDV